MFLLLKLNKDYMIHLQKVDFDFEVLLESLKSNLIKMFERLFCNTGVENLCNDEKQETSKNEVQDDCIKNELEREIQKFNKPFDDLPNKNKSRISKEIFSKELDLYLESSKKTKNISNLLSAFDSIPATSVEA